MKLDWFFDQETEALDSLFKELCGYYCLVLGEGSAEKSKASSIDCQFSVSPALQVGTTGPVADWQALPLATNSIDVALLYHALENDVSYHAVLAEIDRCLVEDGQVVIAQFNPWHINARQARGQLAQQLAGLTCFSRPGRLFFLAHMKGLLKQRGFMIKRVCRLSKRSSSVLQKPCLLTRILNRLFPWRTLGYTILAQKRTMAGTALWRCPWWRWCFGEVKQSPVPSSYQGYKKHMGEKGDRNS